MKSIKNWFRGKKTKPLDSQAEVSTVPFSESQVKEAMAQGEHIEPQHFIFGVGQSVGKQREHNEDNLFALSLAHGGETSGYPIGLFVIADGMGGHQYGEVASATAARTFSASLLKNFYPFRGNPNEALEQSLQELMHSAITDAQKAVTQAAPGSGTTLTAALVMGNQMTIGHVGDSRAYIIRPYGDGEPLTRDHSLVKRLEELGQISSEEAAIHPQRNVLYRALGQGDALEPDIFTAPFPQPGYLLLCSDGLWSVVSQDTLYKTVTTSKDLQGACQKLLDAANDAGGPDNISVIIVKLST